MRSGRRETVHAPGFTKRVSSVPTDAVIVARNEYERIRAASQYRTPEELQAATVAERDGRRATLKGIQSQRAAQISPVVPQEERDRTHAMLEELEDRPYALVVAERQANENLDEIKHLNSLAAAAEARNVRDGQLVELAQRRQEERALEGVWAGRLESNRTEVLAHYEERERSLAEQRRAGRKVIQAQIEEHKIRQILEAEQRDREAKALDAQNAKIAAENERIKAEAKARQAAFLADSLAATEVLKESRIAAKVAADEEARMVREFAAQKALEQQQREQEAAERRALREREIQAIQKKQKRAIDAQAIRDEERAAKIIAEREEQDRAREERDQAAKRAAVTQLVAAREVALEAKRERVARDLAIEQAEADRVIANTRLARQAARAEAEKRKAIDVAYRAELGQDAEAEWRAKQVDGKAKAREAVQAQAARRGYVSKLEQLRQEKLEMLRRKGIAEKHLVDIKAVRFEA